MQLGLVHCILKGSGPMANHRLLNVGSEARDPTANQKVLRQSHCGAIRNRLKLGTINSNGGGLIKFSQQTFRFFEIHRSKSLQKGRCKTLPIRNPVMPTQPVIPIGSSVIKIKRCNSQAI
ncbi:hypothetical protein HanIR_Chr16g0796591 [Helianthus annuus]|nr:hypothetical protein HanIR_Chr16g0796591 [Helianthus annuus]